MKGLAARALDRLLWRPIVERCYGSDAPEAPSLHVLKTFLVWQKVFRINSEVPWPVHPTSRVTCWKRIERRGRSIPGSSPGCYIQAGNGIVLGDNVLLGPNVGLISANHAWEAGTGWDRAGRIVIGDHVWIGMNSVVLPGSCIGDNVVIGAGSVVVGDIPPNSVAVGNPCKVVRQIG
jgi:hypothetical protein